MRRAWALLTLAGLALAAVPGARAEAPVLRVGVVDGAPPCADQQDGVWKGLAIELWSQVAASESLAYRLSRWPTTQELLDASRNDRIDVGVGCINVSPERLGRYRFSLPFQEDGLAVLVIRSPLDLGRAFFGALIGRDLLRLLGGYLLSIALLSALTWWLEGYGQRPETRQLGRRRVFSKVFQVLATGPGSNTLVETVRGNALVLVAYLVRIVAASLLVGFLTVRVVEDTQGRASGAIGSLDDLHGLRVAVRRGSISESLIGALNRSAPSARPIRPLPVGAISEALVAVEQGRADAALGDELQLSWLVRNQPPRRRMPVLALRGIRPESQAFVLAPSLSGPTADRIDRAISTLKRSGLVSELRSRATAPAPATEKGTAEQGEQR